VQPHLDDSLVCMLTSNLQTPLWHLFIWDCVLLSCSAVRHCGASCTLCPHSSARLSMFLCNGNVVWGISSYSALAQDGCDSTYVLHASILIGSQCYSPEPLPVPNPKTGPSQVTHFRPAEPMLHLRSQLPNSSQVPPTFTWRSHLRPSSHLPRSFSPHMGCRILRQLPPSFPWRTCIHLLPSSHLPRSFLLHIGSRTRTQEPDLRGRSRLSCPRRETWFTLGPGELKSLRHVLMQRCLSINS